MEQKINTANPDAIVYNTEEIRYTILGGIRLEGLDRLRVTIKIEVINRKFVHYLNNPELAALAIRQNLDLYNNTQTEKLARLIAERLETGVTQVTKDLSDITSQLENYRLQLLEQKQQKAEQKKILTQQETETAIAFLQQQNLLQATNELIGSSGIIGEELNRLIMYLIFTSRKTARPLHIISFGSSGMGKSHLQEKVGELIPDEEKIEITALTENAFYYFDKAELGHKLILIEDLDGIWSALYPLRELQSKQRISKTVTIKAHQLYSVMDYINTTRKRQLEKSNIESEKLFINERGAKKFFGMMQSLLNLIRKQNRKIKNLEQIRASVITQWVKQYDLRKAQYLAGHKYVRTTENYKQNNIDELKGDIRKYHPF